MWSRKKLVLGIRKFNNWLKLLRFWKFRFKKLSILVILKEKCNILAEILAFSMFLLKFIYLVEFDLKKAIFSYYYLFVSYEIFKRMAFWAGSQKTSWDTKFKCEIWDLDSFILYTNSQVTEALNVRIRAQTSRSGKSML